MDQRANWLHPGIPVLTLLRKKPLAQEELERLGLNPWADPRMPLEVLGTKAGIQWPELDARLEALPDTLAERDWDSVSLPFLLDHLVRDHDDIRDRLLPDIQNALAHSSSLNSDSGRIAYFSEAWPGFAAELIAHMKEEESFLFPRLLHYAHCVKNHVRHPDFTGGSVSVFIAVHLMGNETHLMEALDRFVKGWETSPRAWQSGTDSELQGRIKIFRERIMSHNILETTLLFPRAKALEKALFDAAISGGRVSAPSRP